MPAVTTRGSDQVNATEVHKPRAGSVNRISSSAALGSLVLLAAICVAPATSATPPTPAVGLGLADACASAPAGFATCDAQLLIDASGKPAVTAVATALPSGLGPADIRSAYRLSPTAGTGRTVAVIDAYDDPTAEADLAVYRKKYHLPSCTTTRGCFRKVNQSGGKALPKANAGWAVETSLDLDMVSAACANCRILLVEATTSSMTNLAAAVNYAATQHVAAINNSYNGTDTTQASAYNHPGIAITASTGDTGYGFGAPASFDTVIAVGGTSLKKAHNSRGWSETAWSGSGSGCSTLNAKPAWQSAATGCTGKAAADVSAVADPKTGVAMYDSTRVQGAVGWRVSGGTSAAAAIIAGVYAMSGRTAGYPASYTWTHASTLNDVTTGSSKDCPRLSKKLCTARSGWDGPTGLGTPNGTKSF